MFRITEITFNDGAKFKVRPNDIVVFVGPNNVGKSQALKDIHAFVGHDGDCIVVKDVKTEKGSVDSLFNFLDINAKRSVNNGNTDYSFMGCSINTSWIDQFNSGESFNQYFRPFYFNHLSTDQRLTLANPPSTINPDEAPMHPIHLIKKDGELRKRLSFFFNRAFGKDLIPGSDAREIPLYIGEQILLDGAEKFDNEQDRQEEYLRRLRSYPQVHKQGDGIRSFTGILLNLLMPTINTFLIDEPESFLHPPQARIMGESIAEILPEDKQIFISTHSQDLLKGLLDRNPKRVKIVRITRNGNKNDIRLLDNNDIAEVWSNSLLRHSDILDSLFHTHTVLCESDSDCKLYSIVLDFLKQANNQSNNVLFIHCGGKDRYKFVIHTLRLLGIDYRAIPDIDFLDNKKRVKKLVEESGDSWNVYENDYNTIVSEVVKHDGKIKVDELEIKYKSFLDDLKKSGKSELEKKDIECLRSFTKEPKGWKILKKLGFWGLPSVKDNMLSINDHLKKLHIYLVPVGELECFLPKIGDHGPDWVSKALETYPDLNDKVYDKIKDFIASLNL